MTELSPEDKLRIEQKWGVLTVPKGETRRAKAIRKNALAFQKQQIDVLVECLDVWLKLHPEASAREVQQRYMEHDEALEYITGNKLNALRYGEKRWDWREHQIDVGPVMHQGDGCNTCWAFAATAAAHCSLQKNYWKAADGMICAPDMKTGEIIKLPGAITWWAGDPSPFVQDLLNCMPIKAEELCRIGWHGKAFDFMVYKKGIPMCYTDGYTEENPVSGEIITFRREYKMGQKFECNPNNGFIKASAWDYVNSPPDKLPTVEQLKIALIEHGPLVAPIAYDNNLEKYDGGVFNGKNMGMINHMLLLVGWDDEKEAWLVKNSWGENWGEKGFGWIRYGANNIGVFAAWIEADMSSFRGAQPQI